MKTNTHSKIKEQNIMTLKVRKKTFSRNTPTLKLMYIESSTN